MSCAVAWWRCVWRWTAGRLVPDEALRLPTLFRETDDLLRGEKAK